MRAFLAIALATVSLLATSAFSVPVSRPLCTARHHHHHVVVRCVRPDNDRR